jgi:hypothetical protein
MRSSVSRIGGRLRKMSWQLVMVFAVSVTGISADAQVIVYDTLRPVAVPGPVVAAPPVVVSQPYVSTYVPRGNYAAVTAFSPPVVPVAGFAPTAVVPVTVARPVVAAVPSSSLAVTSYYAPVSTPAPIVSSSVAVPVTVAYTPTVATGYVVPGVAAVPVRRGLFGRRLGYETVPVTYVVP